jgi:hypothetical protein
MTKNLRPLHKTLTEQGFTLVRETRHLIYRHTNGGTLVVSASCSDKHAWRCFAWLLAVHLGISTAFGADA